MHRKRAFARAMAEKCSWFTMFLILHFPAFDSNKKKLGWEIFGSTSSSVFGAYIKYVFNARRCDEVVT